MVVSLSVSASLVAVSAIAAVVFCSWGRLHSTEKEFLLPTQQLQVQILYNPRSAKILSLYYLVGERY